MYNFEQQIRVRLWFSAMDLPVEVSVPWNVLRYLDTHAERRVADDGMVEYVHPSLPSASGILADRGSLCCAAA